MSQRVAGLAGRLVRLAFYDGERIHSPRWTDALWIGSIGWLRSKPKSGHYQLKAKPDGTIARQRTFPSSAKSQASPFVTPTPDVNHKVIPGDGRRSSSMHPRNGAAWSWLNFPSSL